MVFRRFGKHRKSMEGGPQSLGSGVGAEEEREAARKAAREEQERIQEQYRRLLQRQAEMQQVQQIISWCLCHHDILLYCLKASLVVMGVGI